MLTFDSCSNESYSRTLSPLRHDRPASDRPPRRNTEHCSKMRNKASQWAWPREVVKEVREFVFVLNTSNL